MDFLLIAVAAALIAFAGIWRMRPLVAPAARRAVAGQRQMGVRISVDEGRLKRMTAAYAVAYSAAAAAGAETAYVFLSRNGPVSWIGIAAIVLAAASIASWIYPRRVFTAYLVHQAVADGVHLVKMPDGWDGTKD